MSQQAQLDRLVGERYKAASLDRYVGQVKIRFYTGQA
jgi:hypothetical protein